MASWKHKLKLYIQKFDVIFTFAVDAVDVISTLNMKTNLLSASKKLPSASKNVEGGTNVKTPLKFAEWSSGKILWRCSSGCNCTHWIIWMPTPVLFLFDALIHCISLIDCVSKTCTWKYLLLLSVRRIPVVGQHHLTQIDGHWAPTLPICMLLMLSFWWQNSCSLVILELTNFACIFWVDCRRNLFFKIFMNEQFPTKNLFLPKWNSSKNI